MVSYTSFNSIQDQHFQEGLSPLHIV